VLETTQTAILQAVKELELDIFSQLDNTSEMASPNKAEGITLINKNSTPTISTFTVKETISSTISTLSSVDTGTSTISSDSAKSSSSITHNSNNQVVQGNSLFGNASSSTDGTNIGLVVGIPVAIIGTALIVFGIWFYLKQRRNKSKKADETLKNYYDEKYNYKMSPVGEQYSPYRLKSTYQVESNKAHYSNNSPALSNLNSNYKSYNQSDYSLKKPRTGRPNSSWNLNTPLSKWFVKHSQVSGNSSRASLSTGPKTPMTILKEFKLSNLRTKNGKPIAVNERSPILPHFPENAYHPYHSNHRRMSNTSSGSISNQAVENDFTHLKVPKLNPITNNKKRNLNKPLPEKPPRTVSSSSVTLSGLEQRVYERMVPATPVMRKNFADNYIYKVILEYNKNLADELTIERGEHVKILARHRDGWCLVEKCDSKGQSLVDGSDYINDGRGLIPEMCLTMLE
jgi:nuclear fusion protein